MRQEKNRGINMKEDSLISRDDIFAYFISAKDKNANIELENDIRKLGYVYFESDDGYKIVINKNCSEMLMKEIDALNNKYNQQQILINTDNNGLSNITDEEYKTLLEKTNGKCGIKSMSGSGWVVRGYTRKKLGLK